MCDLFRDLKSLTLKNYIFNISFLSSWPSPQFSIMDWVGSDIICNNLALIQTNNLPLK